MNIVRLFPTHVLCFFLLFSPVSVISAQLSPDTKTTRVPVIKQQSPVVKDKTGYCCIKGKIISLTKKVCQNRAGNFFSTRSTASKNCRSTNTLKKNNNINLYGYCCADGEVKKSTEDSCKKTDGYFSRNKNITIRECLKTKGFCCDDGQITSTSKGICEKNKGLFEINKDKAAKVCRELKGYCCLNGKIKPSVKAKCDRVKGRFSILKTKIDKLCLNSKGYCCDDGNISAITNSRCQKIGGTFFTLRSDADKDCRNNKKLAVKSTIQQTSPPIFSRNTTLKKPYQQPDLKITKTWLDNDCVMHVDIKNSGGAITANGFNKARTHISAGPTSTIPSAKQYLKYVDPQGKLKIAGGSTSFNTGLQIKGSQDTLVWVDTKDHIKEINELNNGDDQRLICKKVGSGLKLSPGKQIEKKELQAGKKIQSPTQKPFLTESPNKLTPAVQSSLQKQDSIVDFQPNPHTQTIETGLRILSPTSSSSFLPGDTIPINISFDDETPTAFIKSISLMKGGDLVAMVLSSDFQFGETPHGMVTEGSIPGMAQLSANMSMSLVIPENIEGTGFNYRIMITFDRPGPAAISDDFRIGPLELIQPLQVTYFRGELRANDNDNGLYIVEPAPGTTVQPGQDVELYLALMNERGRCGTQEDVQQDQWEISLISPEPHSSPIQIYSGQVGIRQSLRLPSSPELIGRNVFLYANNISGKNCYATSGLLHVAEDIPEGGSAEVDPDWLFIIRPNNREIFTAGATPQVKWQVHPLTLPKSHFFKSTIRPLDGSSGTTMYPLLAPCYSFNELNRIYTLDSNFSLPYANNLQFDELPQGSYEFCLEMLDEDDRAYSPPARDCRVIVVSRDFTNEDISFRTVEENPSITSGRNVRMQLSIPEEMFRAMDGINSQQIILIRWGSTAMGRVIMTDSHTLPETFDIRLPGDRYTDTDYQLIINIRMGNGRLFQARSNRFHYRFVP